MSNKIKLPLLLGAFLFTITATIFSYEITFRAQTAEEELSYATYLINKLPWYKENKYNIAIPEETDIDTLKKTFTKEIYDGSKFDKGLEVIKQSRKAIEQVLEKLSVLSDNWGFKLMPKYEVRLTLYGPGGSYFTNTGRVVLRTTPEGKFTRKSALQPIVGLIVLMGIDENLVNRYNLTHWEKIRLADLICTTYLAEEFPKNSAQKITDPEALKIDTFINYEAIANDLPSAIEKFVANKKRF